VLTRARKQQRASPSRLPARVPPHRHQGDQWAAAMMIALPTLLVDAARY